MCSSLVCFLTRNVRGLNDSRKLRKVVAYLKTSVWNMLPALMIRLTWVGKQPRVRWETLTLPYDMGGSHTLDLEAYFHAVRCGFAYCWVHGLGNLPHLRLE
ncbi:hypothetical protein NDU88_004207 [Pleurodeles waltl]|uniref:Uncharacterized protein n=1 Tax=Pleurodeles waltl TaxID=8319 RepID=A0AAV7LKN8_PLEWA|nr:hypothetical protein NDU88_004207 [Pleurodeles waltl]